MGPWKGIITNINKGNSTMQLYNLDTDLAEQNDVAARHPDIVAKLQAIMEREHTPYNPVK